MNAKSKTTTKESPDPDDPVVDDVALAELDSVEERHDLRGKNKMSRAKRAQLYKAVQSGIHRGLHPKTLKDACVASFKVSGQTVDKYLSVVKAESIKQSGYYNTQVKEIVQRQLMKIVQDPKATPSEVTRAASQLGDMFDLTQSQDDNHAAEEQLIEDHMRRMDEMSVQELANYIERLRNKKLSAEELFTPWAEPDEKPKKTRRKKTP